VTAREPSKHAGKTVKIRADVKDIGGQEYRVEDWWINVAGVPWGMADSNPAALRYAIRAALSGVPADDEVLYGKVDSLGHLVHVSEIEAVA
jgi:hypothetical protein